MVFQVKGDKGMLSSLTLRLPADEKERIQSDADLAGLSMSEIVRRHYFGRPIIANVDLVMIKELRRLGGLMKHVHTESGGAYSEQTSHAIDEIVNYIDVLSIARKKW